VDRRFRELALVSAALSAAILGDAKFFGPIAEYGRQLRSLGPQAVTREALEDLSIVADKIDAFFEKYRSTPDAGFYIEPPQISGSDDDVRRLRSLITELENLDDSVLSAMAGVAPASGPGSVAPRADLEHSELTKLEHVEPAAPHLLFRKLGRKGTPGDEGGGLAESRRVFVVHGHDHGSREAVARLLTGLHLEPVILSEMPNKGRTIIEKFEAYSDVEFAVVILSPDDLGGVSRDALRPRARQNVILELGFFIGKLGRERVAALRPGELEEPADVTGIVYTTMDPAGAWKTKLGQELRAAGIRVDLNDIH
jgi:hypothetical protein